MKLEILRQGRQRMEEENAQLKATIHDLVEIIDQLRQPYNNGKRHDLYVMATEALNSMEELGRL